MKAAFIGNFILLEFVAFIWAETSSRHHERLLWLSLLPPFPPLFRLILVNPVAELLEKPKNPAVETWLLFAKKQDHARDRLEWSCHGVGTIENRNLLTAWVLWWSLDTYTDSTPVLVVFLMGSRWGCIMLVDLDFYFSWAWVFWYAIVMFIGQYNL